MAPQVPKLDPTSESQRSRQKIVLLWGVVGERGTRQRLDGSDMLLRGLPGWPGRASNKEAES